MREKNARIEMPSTTPGMTSGQSIIIATKVLPRNSALSSTQALTVPRNTASSATGMATLKLLPMLSSQIGSTSTPGLPTTAPEPANHSSVEPRQGGDGNGLALKAKIATTSSGANRNR